MKRIFKYPTGAEIPEGAIYLSTITQTRDKTYYDTSLGQQWDEVWYVWHYFLVEESNQ